MNHVSGLNWKYIAGPKAFLRDKLSLILLAIVTLGLMLLFLSALKADGVILVVVTVLFLGFVIAGLLIDYWHRRGFYRALILNIAQLDQAYLVLETLEQPNFYDGNILYETLYLAHKSMNENIKVYQHESRAFREYVELWIHEVKTPLTALTLMSHNPRVMAELHRLDNLVDQILYFSRAENAEHDYLISKTKLSDVVHQVALRNQSLLLGRSVNLIVRNLDYQVFTDAKWLEFILGQIINNSVKYDSSQIEISAVDRGPEVILAVHDDGVGIDPRDLPRVFEKSFTGHNGHAARANAESSTGMGLYIAKTLCDKMGHQIRVASAPGEGTTVEIIFSSHDYYLTKK